MVFRTGLMLVFLWGATGCAAKNTASYGTLYDFEDDSIDMDSAVGSVASEQTVYAEAERAPPRDESRRSRRRARREMADAPPAISSAPGAPEPAVQDGGDAPEPAVADDQPQDHVRHIIYTATMQVSVFNLEDAMTRAESVPSKYGGYIQSMSAGYFVMRIPAASLQPVMDDLAGLGVVDSRTLDAQDVTEEYLDIETRIAVLEGTQKQMMTLLTKARTVEEALKVRQALDQVTMELEVLKGRLRRLESLTSFSTLTFSLIERGPHMNTPSSNDPFPWVDQLGVEATEWK